MIQNVSLNQTDIEQLTGITIIEFGAAWCGYCQAAQTNIGNALLMFQSVKHIKIEDGKGQRLGRQYAVKLWPTLVFIKDGVEVNRLVRPDNAELIVNALKLIV